MLWFLNYIEPQPEPAEAGGHAKTSQQNDAKRTGTPIESVSLSACLPVFLPSRLLGFLLSCLPACLAACLPCPTLPCLRACVPAPLQAYCLPVWPLAYLSRMFCLLLQHSLARKGLTVFSRCAHSVMPSHEQAAREAMKIYEKLWLWESTEICGNL